MSQPCGCCSGVEVVTPQSEANRPGLPSLTYRAGTYATFFESMVARLSTLYIDVPSSPGSSVLQRIRPLSGLTTRELSDPSIALLDAWAVVADVLTFYQERIANEGYLLTATEHRSILELARLVGYKLRPGVSASVYLAFTAAKAFNGVIPAGTRAQSIPGTGETAQFFETSIDLTAREGWNNLQPRLTRPQVITLNVDSGTDAATRDTLYFQGVSTNLKVGDGMLLVLGNGTGQQVFRFVESVAVQADQNRTEVTLQEPPLQDESTPADNASAALKPFVEQATSIFANSDLAASVATILSELVANVATATGDQASADMVSAAIPRIQEQHDFSERRGFTRLEPWTADVLRVMNSLVAVLANLDNDTVGSGQTQFFPSPLASSPLANLTAIIETLALPRSIQPANSQRLVRTVAQSFATQADIAPRLLAAFRPSIASTLYRAWGGIETPLAEPMVYAMRVKAAPYGNNAPQRTIVPAVGDVPRLEEWPVATIDQSTLLSLDATYNGIVPGSWVVLNSSDVTNGPKILQALSVQTVSRSEYGIAARVTELDLGMIWLPPSSTKVHPAVRTPIEPSAAVLEVPDISTLRRITVWAQPDLLSLAEEPLDTDIEGDRIELAQLYDGLESGRWIIVSGERTDIPNTTGVMASELVMISAVTQGLNAPLCVPFPANYTPFANVFYTTDANSQGDRLVVGELVGDTKGLSQISAMIPLPNTPNQQFCQQAELAAGFYVNAYVPTAKELTGSFPDFQGLLIDPATNQPFPQGVIPASRLGAVFAWRISTGSVHTILTLANSLAYKYDSTSIAIYGNVVNATNGQTVGEILGNGDARQAFQQFTLGQSPLTYISASTPDGIQSTLSLTVNELEWDEAADLASLSPLDRDYITQTSNTDQTTVVFGNGLHGARVPTGSANIKAVYRYGIGSGGNVQAQQISQLATYPQGVQGVINPLPASGGADRDSTDQARQNTPIALLALDRLVSVSDYADFARAFAGIGKAYSARLTDGRRLVVHVTIAGAEDIPVDPTSDLYANLLQAFGQYGDPYLPVQLALRTLRLLVLSAGIKLLPGYQWESVEAAVRAAVLAAFSFDARALGQSAFLSEAIGVMQAVEGVSYVDVRIFDGVPESSTASQLAGLANTLSLNNYVLAELTRIDPTATDVTNRILPAELVVMTPDIPDTLILTQVTQ